MTELHNGFDTIDAEKGGVYLFNGVPAGAGTPDAASVREKLGEAENPGEIEGVSEDWEDDYWGSVAVAGKAEMLDNLPGPALAQPVAMFNIPDGADSVDLDYRAMLNDIVEMDQGRSLLNEQGYDQEPENFLERDPDGFHVRVLSTSDLQDVEREDIYGAVRDHGYDVANSDILL